MKIIKAIVTTIVILFVILFSYGLAKAETLETYADVCAGNPEYGRILKGSDCFDWEQYGEGRLLYCILDGETRISVRSNRECSELANAYGYANPRTEIYDINNLDTVRHPDGDSYREKWCASRNTISAFSQWVFGVRWYGYSELCPEW